MRQHQLERHTTSFYRILFSTNPWLDKKIKDMSKPFFIHGDKIDSPTEKVTDFVTYTYTNSKGNDVVVSLRAQYKRFLSFRLKRTKISARYERFSEATSGSTQLGSFITPTPFYNNRRGVITMTILELGLTMNILDVMFIHHI